MEEIKAPKKERKFLKAIGNIGKVLAEELVMGIARKFIGKAIDKVGNKKQGLVIAFIVLASSFVFAQFPTNTNKQRLGFQTTADGLVWRGSLSDTASIQPVSNQNAWVILDTVNLKIYSFDFSSNVWGLVGGGSAAFTQPIDSLFFNVNVPTDNVDTAKMRWDSDLATVVLGLNDNVPNEIGFKNFWLVKNQTGSTITKGSLVYANGTVGASGRITVAKFIANGTIDAKYLLGITAHDLSNGEDGYVISFGKIRKVNTDTFAAGAILYPSPTTAGVWTDVEPIAPNLDMPIGFCINSHVNNGTIAIRVASGYKLSELHDLAISSPVTNASLYFKSGIWRDTTATLLLSDTAAMLLPYLRKADTTSMLLPYFRDGDTSLLNLTNRFNTKLNLSDTAAMLLNYKNTLNLKLNISDTASMLSNYALKSYADTSGRFYARQDFTNVSSSTLTWTQSDTLVTGAVTFIQVYRNGQILLPSQYTIPTNASVVIGATAFKVGENYTVIFPRGGGASSGGGSGSLTSISGGTGIIVNPNPITTTGTVSADLSVLMELTDTTLLNLNTRFSSKLNLSDTAAMLTPYFRDADTTLLNLTNRFNTKLNISDTTNMLLPYFRDGDTSLLNLTNRFALKLNATDTASLSNRINAKGTGTVTSVGSGFGLLGGTITTTGTLLLDSAVIFTRIRDSIVDVAIGNDTIKILKQEYNAASSSVLTWTITPKFPIQLKAYILVFRNGQLLNNDQYNLTDTNKITIVSTSFKIGANYTVATVSGIGSVGSAQAGNPVYPEAGIALSTGTTWASSITNNSSNWNTAFTDRLKWDGGSTGLVASTGRTSLGGTTIGQSMFTLTNPSAITFPRFNADNTVSSLTAANFRTAIGAGTVTTVNAATTSGNPISIDNNTTTPTIELLSATSARNGYLTSTDWTTFNNKQAALGFTPANSTITIATTAPLQGGGNLTANRTLSITQATTSANGFLTSTDWNTFNAKQNTLVSGTTIKTVNGTTLLGSGNLSVGTLVATDTASLSNRINLKVNISDTSAMLLPYLKKVDTTAMLLPYFRDNDTTLLNLPSRFNAKVNLSDTLNMLAPYLRKADTTSMLSPYFRDADTTLLNLTNRFNTKLNISDTTLMLSKYLRKLDTITLSNRINLKLNISDTASMLLPYLKDADTSSLNLNARFNAKVNISDTTNMLLPYLRKKDTINMLLPYLRKADTSLLNLTNRFNTKLNISDTLNMLSRYLRKADTTSMLLPYFRDADTSLLNLTNRFNTKLNISDTTNMLSRYLRRADTTLMLLPYLRKTDTTNMLLPYFRDGDTTLLNLTNRFNTKLNISDTTIMLSKYLRKLDTITLSNRINLKVNISDTASMLTPYFRDNDTTQLNLTSRFAGKQNNITLTTTGTSGLATFNGTTLNIPNYTASGGTGTVTSVGLTAPSIFNVGGSPITTNGTLALTYSGTALPLLNGGTGATTADGALTNLGVTTVGKALLVADNSVSDKFIKVNADKTITLLDAADTRTAIGAGNISGVGSSSYLPIFSSSSYIGQSLLRWDGNSIPNSTFINDYNFNQFSALAGTGTRMVVASSTGLLSTQAIGTSVTSFSAGTTGFTPNTATTGVVTLAGILAITNGGTGANSASTARTALGATVRGANVFTLPDIDQVSFIRYNANNTVSQRTAEGIRIDLGGTTLGQNMFMLTNPSAITFPRFNADNTVSALDAASFRTAIGVTASTQSNLYIALNGPTIVLSTSMGDQSTYFLSIDNTNTVTVTLPTASLNTNKSITIKNAGSGAVISNGTNVQRLTGTLTNSILISGGGKFATLVSDGFNWITMAAN
jgi:hypothetical protein